MTQDEIIEMAIQVELKSPDLFKLTVSHMSIKQLHFFAKLVAAKATASEREACANLVGEFAQKWWSIHCDSNKHMETTRKAHDDFCALQVAIRARGKA
jgi:hypothetical protein